MFHADPRPGNVLLLADGQLSLLDFGSVSGLRVGGQGGRRVAWRAAERARGRRPGSPAGLWDGLLKIVDRPD
ncbi:AarF/UbiB family protein [Actinophytocola sp.]|uniref:AarF/UbiB family protein n=1 Tax=Actinophytocola sp. TaxID=1872138 RepID=UPI002D604BD9|nr:AarF/UbiB family protein [Actinophytocola sp.]HYQ62792.1 AarF/UbiB family protein [Actinophytocola sp.]